MDIKQMIEKIREVICQTDRSIPEIEVMAALVDEADSWHMRLRELEDAAEG